MTGRCNISPCDCLTVGRTDLRVLCPHWDATRPAAAFEAEAIARWKTVPPEHREVCVQHLSRSLIGHDVIVAVFKRQRASGAALGSDDPRFHFAAGMAIRNILRQVMPDCDLPPRESGEQSNWDDYYYGCLDETVASWK